jgi:hypothetical protein
MLQPYKSFGMVCAEIPCTNHAKPSLCSGTDLKVKPMLDVYKLPEYVKYITKFVGSFACRIENDGFVLHYQ